MTLDSPAKGDPTIELMHIGELARRTGLSVKTIRYYSDEGLVPEASRTATGYRRYDQAALARLEFVRTLRTLGLDLGTIRQVLDRQADLRSVAAAHAEALAAQIRLLRVQRAALRALARREPTPTEVEHVNRIVQATAEERRRIVTEFLDQIFDFGAGPVDNEFTAMLRQVTPDLPDEPSDAQLDAWLELHELLGDPDFLARLREMGRRSFGGGGTGGGGTGAATTSINRETATLVTERVGAAVRAGIAPSDPAAAPVVGELVAALCAAGDGTDSEGYRAELRSGIESGTDPRAERYWQLMAIINGWPPVPSTAHLWEWFAAALRAWSCPM
jgi:DNA-binding transcriptional MerR regulator